MFEVKFLNNSFIFHAGNLKVRKKNHFFYLQYDYKSATFVRRNVRAPKIPSQLHTYKTIFQIRSGVFLVYPNEPKLKLWSVIGKKRKWCLNEITKD